MRYDRKTAERAARWYATHEHATMVDVARMFGVTHSVVRTAVIRLGLADRLPGRGGASANPTMERASKMVDRCPDMTVAEVAATFGIQPMALFQHRHRRGLATRGRRAARQ